MINSKDILLPSVDHASPAAYEQHSCAHDDGSKNLPCHRSHDVKEPRIAHDVAPSRSGVMPVCLRKVRTWRDL